MPLARQQLACCGPWPASLRLDIAPAWPHPNAQLPRRRHQSAPPPAWPRSKVMGGPRLLDSSRMPHVTQQRARRHPWSAFVRLNLALACLGARPTPNSHAIGTTQSAPPLAEPRACEVVWRAAWDGGRMPHIRQQLHCCSPSAAIRRWSSSSRVRLHAAKTQVAATDHPVRGCAGAAPAQWARRECWIAAASHARSSSSIATALALRSADAAPAAVSARTPQTQVAATDHPRSAAAPAPRQRIGRAASAG